MLVDGETWPRRSQDAPPCIGLESCRRSQWAQTTLQALLGALDRPGGMLESARRQASCSEARRGLVEALIKYLELGDQVARLLALTSLPADDCSKTRGVCALQRRFCQQCLELGGADAAMSSTGFHAAPDLAH